MAAATRGFTGRARRGRDERLPPGQYDVGADFPVLTAEVTPRLVPERWTMTVDGLVGAQLTWSWDEIRQLPRSEYRGDIHCVTTWSKLDTSFGGVSLDVLLEAVVPEPRASHTMATSTTGYTTNLPLADLSGGKAWLVWTHEGKPLPVEHGGPVRLLVPHLYFWKSAKWITRLTLADKDSPGFWERNGYHDRGDPWFQQRYQGDCAGPRAGRRLAPSSSSPSHASQPAVGAVTPGRARPGQAAARPALRGAAHRRGRLHRLALVLGGLGAGGRLDRSIRRTARRWRGLGLSGRRGRTG
jgi:DMSO/TMAO reductase YedYZ molybdopterin-dependent catalytic subunit